MVYSVTYNDVLETIRKRNIVLRPEGTEVWVPLIDKSYTLNTFDNMMFPVFSLRVMVFPKASTIDDPTVLRFHLLVHPIAHMAMVKVEKEHHQLRHNLQVSIQKLIKFLRHLMPCRAPRSCPAWARPGIKDMREDIGLLIITGREVSNLIVKHNLKGYNSRVRRLLEDMDQSVPERDARQNVMEKLVMEHRRISDIVMDLLAVIEDGIKERIERDGTTLYPYTRISSIISIRETLLSMFSDLREEVQESIKFSANSFVMDFNPDGFRKL